MRINFDMLRLLWGLIGLFLICPLLISCKRPTVTLFSQLDAIRTGIRFNNILEETETQNIFTYEYLYNGGGVGVGDFNNDGLPDLYFTGNTVANKLYVNAGNMHFKDVTIQAGVSGKKAWKTGVSIADINGDGWLDVYVCYSGLGTDEDRADQLFINDAGRPGAIPTFTERAREYGLDAPGTFTTQVAFFDYDLDGDLDMFQLNHANQFYSPFFNTRRLRQARHPKYGNRLYRNEGNHFTETSTEAGIMGSGLNYGLGVAISDLNQDGWPDIYVTNDYEEQDFLYLNNHDGTFRETLKESLSHISKYSMGVDVADINNDIRPDVITMDMLPEDNHRQKLLRGADEYDKYQIAVDSGYHRQQMRNMLQLHQGYSPAGIPVFSEIGQLAGISNTDWSWSALLADFDNDGFKDLFVTNGYVRDFTNLDFLKYDFADARQQAGTGDNALYSSDGRANNVRLLYELTRNIPTSKVSNYAFRNGGQLQFSNQTSAWGLQNSTVTTGAAYVDLDNDGDLDIVTNNTNASAGIYRNNTDQLGRNHHLRVKLVGEKANRFGIGAKVYVTTRFSQQVQEAYPVRGYQSTVDNTLLFGLGAATQVADVCVMWPGGHISSYQGIKADTTLVVRQTESGANLPLSVADKATQPLFKDFTNLSGLFYRQQENSYVDVKFEPLIPVQLSRQGPMMAKGDVDGNGTEDVFIGGPAGQSGQLFLQSLDGTFVSASKQPWSADKSCEDVGCLFFDADTDGDLDLYVVSGGNEFPLGSAQLQDRLYINGGRGQFSQAAPGTIPIETASGSCVVSADYDQDGDLDLFVGGRIRPGQYPLTSPGGILRNDTDRQTHQVLFTVATAEVCPALKQPGMVTDALWTDVNGDHWPDLLVVGEWMPISLFINQGGKLVDQSKAAGLAGTGGFWNRISSGDLDNDGDTDYILGNLGLNSSFRASPTQPIQLYAGDFNDDGRIDPLICQYTQGKSYPVASRDELLEQISTLRKKFIRYAQYADVTIRQVIDPDMLDKAHVSTVSILQSSYLENKGNGQFRLHPLPIETQFSTVQGIVTGEFTGDSHLDILLAGNYFPFRVREGPCDASFGILLAGDGKGHFRPIPRQFSNLYLTGDVRDLLILNNMQGKRTIIASKNEGTVQVIFPTNE